MVLNRIYKYMHIHLRTSKLNLSCTVVGNYTNSHFATCDFCYSPTLAEGRQTNAHYTYNWLYKLTDCDLINECFIPTLGRYTLA